MADNLTPRQQEILDFIRHTLEALGAPPTRAEIASAFGFASPNAAEDRAFLAALATGLRRGGDDALPMLRAARR